MTTKTHTSLPRGSVIGIVGGGQLGQMLAVAATRLGYKTHVYATCDDSPARQAASYGTVGSYEDIKTVSEFGRACDVVTYEFENIPVDTVSAIESSCPVRPGINPLSIIQDRLTEKSFIRDAGVSVTPFVNVMNETDLSHAIDTLGLPLVLKTRRFGYDGKGQVIIKDVSEASNALEKLGPVPLIAEKFIQFTREISVVAARGLTGEMKAYPPGENLHEHHILSRTIAPAENTDLQASDIAFKLLKSLDYVGVMGVEFFELEDGTLIVNEIAPRVHNSGHWTQNAGCIDQFELHIRAITGLTLGDLIPKHSVEMINLIGNDVSDLSGYTDQSGTFIHLYGKSEVRPGRKMGHINRIISDA